MACDDVRVGLSVLCVVTHWQGEALISVSNSSNVGDATIVAGLSKRYSSSVSITRTAGEAISAT